jgi:hypothetical protein
VRSEEFWFPEAGHWAMEERESAHDEIGMREQSEVDLHHPHPKVTSAKHELQSG